MYLSFNGLLNQAYETSGKAARLCYQYGFHHQARWPSQISAFEIHMRQRLCWTLFYVERRIAQSCGRPYAIRELDVNVAFPASLNDQATFSDQLLPPSSPMQSDMPYLHSQVVYTQFYGSIWDQMFAASLDVVDRIAVVPVVDARISYWLEVDFRAAFPDEACLASPARTRQAAIIFTVR